MSQRNCFDTDVRAVLAGAVADAIETMAFVTLEPTLAPQGDPRVADLKLVQIDFSGHGVDGTLDLLVGAGLGASLAASIAGEDAGPGESDPRGDDALRELANVACGAVLRSLASGVERPRFSLALPTLRPLAGEGGAPEARAVLDDPDTATFDAEGFLLAARLRITSIAGAQVTR